MNLQLGIWGTINKSSNPNQNINNNINHQNINK
jgi:hypothetical protein